VPFFIFVGLTLNLFIMKKLIILLFVGFLGFGQEMPKITKEGLTPIIVNVEGKTSAEIYAKAKEWVQTYYKNPSDVLKADIPNEMIRIEGYAVDGYKTKNLGVAYGYDYDYILEIEFKEGRYRYNYIVGQFWSLGSRVLYGYKYFFKDDGTIKKTQQLAYDTLNETINNTSYSLFNYITGKTQSEKSDW
jgi:hypothetical protein